MIAIEDADSRGDFQMKGSLVSEGASKPSGAIVSTT